MKRLEDGFQKIHRVAIVLPGIHRVNRGAEMAFEAIGREIAKIPGWSVTLFGSGLVREGEPYSFVHVPCKPREQFEKWPRMPLFRSETAWEEFSFVWNLRKVYRPEEFDATISCSFPFCNWFLRRRGRNGRRPVSLFVTQNGDWACQRRNREYRWFDCDALICTNPEYYDRHKDRYFVRLIPNGVDSSSFCPGPSARPEFGLPADARVILMVSALIPSKRVLEGIEAAAKIKDVWLVVAGDGPLRAEVQKLGSELLCNRFRQIVIRSSRMPDLYRSVDAVLHMSVEEPFGNVFTESLAVGTPIVTHDSSVTRWILQDTSYLVDSRRPELLNQAIREAINESSDMKVKKRIQLARERFSWKFLSSQYCSAINDIMSSSFEY